MYVAKKLAILSVYVVQETISDGFQLPGLGIITLMCLKKWSWTTLG